MVKVVSPSCSACYNPNSWLDTRGALQILSVVVMGGGNQPTAAMGGRHAEPLDETILLGVGLDDAIPTVRLLTSARRAGFARLVCQYK